MNRDYDRLLGDLARTLGAVDPAETRALVRALADARAVFVAGAGRSGLLGRAFAMRLAHLGLRVHAAGDATTPAIGAGDLLLACSGSGKTEAVLSMAVRARQAGARVALVTGAIIAPLTQVAHQRVLLPPIIPAAAQRAEPPDPDAFFQPMRTLFEQALLLFLDRVTLDLMDALGVSPQDMERRHSNLE
ncbi:MAG TPA: 6-phospho-3-hexuloisomerase [Planctomycetota bacterium]|nr:6-phospho-3-hexuloisomerase [Planctomycetota bacterium]